MDIERLIQTILEAEIGQCEVSVDGEEDDIYCTDKIIMSTGSARHKCRATVTSFLSPSTEIISQKASGPVGQSSSAEAISYAVA